MNKDKTLKETILEALDEELYPVCLDEMSTIIADTKDGGMCIVVNANETRKGMPYFKVVNHNSFVKAEKIARISFLKPEYIIHKNRDGKADWHLNSQEKRHMIELLHQKSAVLNYSIWKYAIAQYNMENSYILDIKDASNIKMSDVKNFETDPLPIDLPMPNYMKL